MKNLNLVVPQYEQFVDANVAAYTLNLPMYYLTNAAQRCQVGCPALSPWTYGQIQAV